MLFRAECASRLAHLPTLLPATFQRIVRLLYRSEHFIVGELIEIHVGAKSKVLAAQKPGNPFQQLENNVGRKEFEQYERIVESVLVVCVPVKITADKRSEPQ